MTIVYRCCLFFFSLDDRVYVVPKTPGAHNGTAGFSPHGEMSHSKPRIKNQLGIIIEGLLARPARLDVTAAEVYGGMSEFI